MIPENFEDDVMAVSGADAFLENSGAPGATARSTQQRNRYGTSVSWTAILKGGNTDAR